MKITRGQLKRIIKEARSPNDMAPQIMQDQEDTELMNKYSDIDDYFDGGYDEEDREWIVYSELSGRFEPSGIRDPSELGKIKAYINVNGQAARQHYGSQMSASMMENKMKITRRQLRRIIKEAMAAGPQTYSQWVSWGRSHGLREERTGNGSVMFRTKDRAVADEARSFGAQTGMKADGTFMIYTGA